MISSQLCAGTQTSGCSCVAPEATCAAGSAPGRRNFLEFWTVHGCRQGRHVGLGSPGGRQGDLHMVGSHCRLRSAGLLQMARCCRLLCGSIVCTCYKRMWLSVGVARGRHGMADHSSLRRGQAGCSTSRRSTEQCCRGEGRAHAAQPWNGRTQAAHCHRPPASCENCLHLYQPKAVVPINRVPRSDGCK